MKIRIALLITFALLTVGCERVGSDAWCESLDEKPKGDWTKDESKANLKYCVLGFDSEKWCEKLEEKPKGDWTANEASDYAQNCVFDRTDDELESVDEPESDDELESK